MHSFTGSCLGVIPSKCANGTVLATAVGEVASHALGSTVEVLAISATVVVHVYRCPSFRKCPCHRCHGTWGLRTFRSRSGDGSHSRSFGEVLDDSNVFGATVVVHTKVVKLDGSEGSGHCAPFVNVRVSRRGTRRIPGM